MERQVRRYEPCLPRLAKEPPAGPGWIHEIKHDGFRILAELNVGDVKLITRKGFDLAQRFPLATTAIAAVQARSCIVDSEAIACDANGLSVFDLLRFRRQDDAVTLCAFDLLELDGVDLRREPLRLANAPSRGYCGARIMGSLSTVTSTWRARSFTDTPARSAVRALYRSDLARPIGQGVPTTG